MSLHAEPASPPAREITVEPRRDGGRVEGSLANGRKEGVWRRFYADGTLAEELTYRDGALTGPATSWHPNGKRASERHYLAGRLVGPWQSWHGNGASWAEGEWLDGQPHRSYQAFWPNGQPAVSGEYALGRPVGTWTWHDERGEVVEVVAYDPVN